MVNNEKTGKTGEDTSRTGIVGAWGRLKEVVFRGSKQLDAQPESRNIQGAESVDNQREQLRQDDKLASAILYGVDQLSRPSSQITPSEKHAALQKISTNEFSERNVADALAKIASPLDIKGDDAVYDGISKNQLSLYIFRESNRAIDSARGDDRTLRGAEVYRGPVEKFIKSFPTPVEFAPLEQAITERFKQQQSSPTQQKELDNAMAYFKKQVFGKREEYYESFKRLEKQAELAQIFDKANIDGDQFVARGGRVMKLDKQFLQEKNLLPHKSITIEDTVVAFSKPFTSNKHNIVIAYIQNGDKVKASSYYFSRSQGVWRLMPDYIAGSETGQGVGRFGKGYTEEQTILPEKLQEALNDNLKSPVLPLSEEDAEFALAGTAKRYDSVNSYRNHLREGSMRGDFYEEVNHKPLIELSPRELGLKKVAPDTLDISGPLAPDFSRLNSKRFLDSELYGRLTSYIFPSEDGRLSYNFEVDSRGRAFIAGAEVNSKLSSDGVRTEWARLGDMSTPLYDYAVQSDGYGDSADAISGTNYVSMWKNYLSKMPIIQKFIKHLQR